MEPKTRGFSKAERVGRHAEFQEIYKRGARLRGRFLTLFVLPNTCRRARLGIAATRKLGNAVWRNRAKRLVREWFRHNKPRDAFDIVVIPGREFLDAPRAALDADYRATLQRFLRARAGR